MKKDPVSDMYPLTDHQTSTQPYIFKVEYHQVTTLHTHYYSQYVYILWVISLCKQNTTVRRA